MESSENRDVSLSKSLSFLLRVHAIDEGLDMDQQGFVQITQILQLPRFRKYTKEQILKVVETDDKQRYSLRDDNGKLFIRANQGHQIPNIDPGLKRITDVKDYEKVIHGTNEIAYELIRFEGLSKMERNHIHFAIGEPGESGVISGMAEESTVYIYIDLNKALNDGITFFESVNKVVLCPGNEDGYLPAKYFKKVLDTKTGKERDDFLKSDFKAVDYRLDRDKISVLIHPTSHRDYSRIRRVGLKKTKGNYIHFLTQEPKDVECQIMIYLDLKKFGQEMDNMYQFTETEALYKGNVSTDYFLKVIEVKTGSLLPY